MLKLKQGGYSLIEVILVIAIVAGLLAAIWAGTSQFRARSQYSASIEILKNNLKRVQNEATTTVNSGSAGVTANGDSNSVVFGKMVVFDPAQNYAVVKTLTVSDGNAAAITIQDTYNQPLGQHLKFVPSISGDCEAIVFTRAPDNIYTLPPDGACYSNPAGPAYDAGRYNAGDANFNPGVWKFQFDDTDFPFSAKIVVDTQNTTLTRCFDAC